MDTSAAPTSEAAVSTNAPRRAGSDYAVLSRQVRDAGLLRRRPVRGTVLLIATAVMLAGAWAGFVVIGESWWQLAFALPLAFAFTQCGFRGHEVGHRQTFASKRLNNLVGLVYGNLFIGLGFGWWMHKHNRHHAHPNQVGRDPDVETGAIVFDEADATDKTGLKAFMARHQAGMFFPLLLLEGWNLHVASARALRSCPRGSPAPVAVEALLLLAHAAAYVTVVAWVLSPLQALVFILVHQGLFGLYLGCSFAPNHKGMDMLGPDERLDFLRSQVLTSRNVRGGAITDFVLGGLNHQIEHHLFPSMPTWALPRARALVRTHCEDLDLPYTEIGLIDSYRQALRHLHSVGRPLRTDT